MPHHDHGGTTCRWPSATDGCIGLTDPYVAVTEPPDDYAKLRRHKHKRYRFEPLEGAGEF